METRVSLKYLVNGCSTIIFTGLVFQKKCHKFQVIILLTRDLKHSRRQGMVNTVNKLLKFQSLDTGFHFLEFKSNQLNNDDSLNMEPFYDDALHLGKGMNYWKDKLLTFTNIWNARQLIENLHHIGRWLLFNLKRRVSTLFF